VRHLDSNHQTVMPGAWKTWLAGQDLIFFATLVAAAASVFVFFELAQDVMHGDTRAFDEAILLALRNPADPSDPIGPRWFEEMMRDLSALGGTAMLTIITLAVAGFLFITDKRHAAFKVLAAVATGTVLSQMLKWGFARPRPDLVPHGAEVYTASFPSGHSMLSAVVYLTLAALVAQTQPSRRVRAYLIALAIVLTVLVGASRIYLGVHWPTDVLGGWVVGAAWALLCWLLLLRLRRERYDHDLT
jgi:undecaprenyl-diphosphatase